MPDHTFMPRAHYHHLQHRALRYLERARCARSFPQSYLLKYQCKFVPKRRPALPPRAQMYPTIES